MGLFLLVLIEENIKMPKKVIKKKYLKKTQKVLLPKLKVGTLKKHGYSDVKNLSVEKRHIALKKAIKEYGYSHVIKKVNAVELLSRNRNPKISKIFGADKKWMERYYGIK